MDLFKRANMDLATALEVMGCRYVSRRPCNRAKDKRLIARYARRKLKSDLREKLQTCCDVVSI